MVRVSARDRRSHLQPLPVTRLVSCRKVCGSHGRILTLPPIGVGRAALPLPLPPNRTGGFPASGFPVSGVSARLTIGTRAVFQTKQPLRRKPPVGPPSAVGLAQPVAGPFLPFAQHRPQASPQPAVRTTQARTMALPEVAVPAPQDGIGLRNDLAQRSELHTSELQSRREL